MKQGYYYPLLTNMATRNAELKKLIHVQQFLTTFKETDTVTAYRTTKRQKLIKVLKLIVSIKYLGRYSSMKKDDDT